MTKKQTTITSIILIIILGFAVYANSLNGKFIWDDDYLISNNIYIKNISYAPKLFIKNIGAGAGVKKRQFLSPPSAAYLYDRLLSVGDGCKRLSPY